MRLLTEDDIDGICTIYEPDGTRSVDAPAFPKGSVLETSCDPTPMGGFTTQCMSTGGCSASPVAPERPAGGETWVPALAVVVVLAGRRKRAR